MIKSTFIVPLLLLSQVFAASEYKLGDKCDSNDLDANFCETGNLTTMLQCVQPKGSLDNILIKAQTCNYCCNSPISAKNAKCFNSQSECQEYRDGISHYLGLRSS